MAIIYYPDEVFKMRRHVVEQLQQPNVLYSVFGTQDLSAGDLAAGVWSPRGWEIRRVCLTFDSSSNKDYDVSVVHGIGISTGKNDRLWVKVPGMAPVGIIIPQGFYDGATMTAALKAALDASDLPAESKAFTVSYNSTDGKFTIAPNAGTMQVLVTNPGVNVRINSTLAPLLGFTVTTAGAASVESDTGILDLGQKMTYLRAAGTSETVVLSSDVIAMTIDNQLLMEATSTASMIVSYEAVYKILDA